MRVVKQLILHFWDSGAIARAQADYLVANGFIHEADLPGYALDQDDAPAETSESTVGPVDAAIPAAIDPAPRGRMRPRCGERRGQERVGRPGQSRKRWWGGYQLGQLAKRRRARGKGS